MGRPSHLPLLERSINIGGCADYEALNNVIISIILLPDFAYSQIFFQTRTIHVWFQDIKNNRLNDNFCMFYSVVVKALSYQPEGRGFDSR
jgi:hypothetical protein